MNIIFNPPNIPDDNIIKYINDWSHLISEQEKKVEDIWTIIPCFPNLSFKNLRIEPSTNEDKDENITFTFICDYYHENI